MTSPVFVIQHEDDCPPGLLAEVAAEMGVALRICEADKSGPLPRNLDGYSGLIVLGGRMSAYDDERYRWLTATKTLLADAVVGGVPTLGVCLGHQLATVALEGEVDKHPKGPTRGVVPVDLTDAGRADPLLGSLNKRPQAPMTTHWNSDIVVEPPPGAVVLARDPHGYPQALRFAERAWGVQCHPELVTGIVGWWRDLTDPSSQPGGAGALEAAVIDVEEALPLLHAQWRPVLAAFVQLAAGMSR